MKRTLTIFLAIAGTAVLASSCLKDEIGRAGSGCLSLGVEMSETLTKAGSSPASDLIDNATVKIYYADFSGMVRNYTYATAPSEIWLPANDYRVDVEAGEAVKDSPARASWTSKSYKGSSSFTIEAGKHKDVQVVAGISNAVSKVSFDNTIAENFNSGYKLTIGTDKDDAASQLVYDASNAGAEGYFLINGLDEPSFWWKFEGALSRKNEALVKEGTINGIEKGKAYALTLKYTVKDGIGTFDVYVDYSEEIIQDDIIFEPLSTGLAASEDYEIWAAHATVHADVDESEYSDPSLIKFSYTTDGISWITVPAVRNAEGSYSAVLEQLSPSTNYSYKLVIDDEDMGDPMEFTTDVAPDVPNGSFEASSKSKSGNYMEFYDPSSSDPASRTAWWGSGNGSEGVEGSADYGNFIICKPDTSVKVDGNQSACLQSTWALVKFAAGNLFSGYFGGLVGTKGGIVYFGRPFVGRPAALKVWVKYSTSKMDHIDGSPAGTTLSTSMYDIGRIQVAVGNWDYRKYGGNGVSPILVNTTDESTFVDYGNDSSTIAYGELELQGDSSNSHNEWKEYIIPLDYSNIYDTPTHIVISCAASKYGDYFSGCSTSKMWVDKMELVYE